MRTALRLLGTLGFMIGAVYLSRILIGGTWESESVRGTWLVVLTVGSLLAAWAANWLPGAGGRRRRLRHDDTAFDRRSRRGSSSRPRRSSRPSRRRSKPRRSTRSKPRRRR